MFFSLFRFFFSYFLSSLFLLTLTELDVCVFACILPYLILKTILLLLLLLLQCSTTAALIIYKMNSDLRRKYTRGKVAVRLVFCNNILNNKDMI